MLYVWWLIANKYYTLTVSNLLCDNFSYVLRFFKIFDFLFLKHAAVQSSVFFNIGSLPDKSTTGTAQSLCLFLKIFCVHFMQGSTLKEKPRVTVTSTSDLSEYEKLVNHRRAYNNKIR